MLVVKPSHLLQTPHYDTRELPAVVSGEAGASLQPRQWFAPHRATLEGNVEVDLTFFVACYNEEKNICQTLENLCQVMSALPFTFEIIVVDDASKDRSAELVQQFQESHPDLALHLLRNPKNRGLSRNFVEAAFLGRGRCYKLVCGDNVDDKASLQATLLQIGHADLIVPYHLEIQGRAWSRRMLSSTYTRIVNLLSGQSLRYYNGCAVYRRADVMRWHARTSGFGFQAELITRLLIEGVSYVQVPIVGKERPDGKSTALRLRNWLSVGRTLFSIFMQRLWGR